MSNGLMRGCSGQRSVCSGAHRGGVLPSVRRPSVQVTAGKGSQKNQGMYFEYERVGGADEEEALLREAGEHTRHAAPCGVHVWAMHAVGEARMDGGRTPCMP
jgi:hypothetical protein